MDLNLSILAGDLAQWHPMLSLSCKRIARSLKYVIPVEGQTLDDESVLYAARGGEAAALDPPKPVNLLLVGRPDAGFSNSFEGNLLVLEADEAAFGTVFKQCADLLSRYERAYTRIAEHVSRGKPMTDVARLCSELVGRPLSIWGFERTELLFSNDDGPLGFALRQRNPEISETLHDGAEKAHARAADTFTALLPNGSPLLCRRLCIKDNLVAVLVMESDNQVAEERNRAVLNIVASPLQRCLKRNGTTSLLSPNALVAQMRMLLSREITSWQLLEDTIGDFGWNLLDEYLCAVVAPRGTTALGASLIASMTKLDAELPEAVCLAWKDGITFVVNLSRSEASYEQVVATMAQTCEKHRPDCALGVSVPFSELQDLHHYRQQAEKAVELGGVLNPASSIHLFKDYYLDFVAQCCLKHSSATALFPPGYNRLKNYEHGRERSGSLESFLHRLIDNDFQMKPTVADEYCSRTTAFSKLKKIKQITGMDLDDPYTRAALHIATRAIRLSKLAPQLAGDDPRKENR